MVSTPFEKYARQIGSFPQVEVKIKKIETTTQFLPVLKMIRQLYVRKLWNLIDIDFQNIGFSVYMFFFLNCPDFTKESVSSKKPITYPTFGSWEVSKISPRECLWLDDFGMGYLDIPQNRVIV